MSSRSSHFVLQGVFVMLFCVAPIVAAQIPSIRGLAELEFRAGERYEKSGSLALAEESFTTVWGMEDEDHEFADIRALAGIHLVTLLLRQDKPEEALVWLEKVANMKDVSDDFTSAAKARLETLRKVVEGRRP